MKLSDEQSRSTKLLLCNGRDDFGSNLRILEHDCVQVSSESGLYRMDEFRIDVQLRSESACQRGLYSAWVTETLRTACEPSVRPSPSAFSCWRTSSRELFFCDETFQHDEVFLGFSELLPILHQVRFNFANLGEQEIDMLFLAFGRFPCG